MAQTNNRERGGKKGPARCSGLAQLLSPQLFKALSDPKRLELLVRVAEGGGPSTVSHIARGSNVDMSVVSRHLAVLREAGIIRCEKRGKEVLCTLRTGTIAGALRRLADALESCCPLEVPGDPPAKTPRPPRRK